jgi:hypothetical protein
MGGGGKAKQTNIPDADGAKSALVAFGAHAAKLQTDLKTHTDRITSLEAGKPWGKTEYGTNFEKAYNAGTGGNGADFVKNNVKVVADEMLQGGEMAYVAISNSVELDQVDLKNMFVTGDSKTAGAGLTATNSAYNTEMNNQNKAAQG